jgi:hypothetical protein
MAPTEESLKEDIQRISSIPFLPILLDVVCAATGLGFAAVARVTEDRWIAGGVKDMIQFGMTVGSELPIHTTICHEIREHHTPVVIDHVSYDARFCGHHTPAMYGFESYISFPIIRTSGEFYGTLCAIDPKAAMLNTQPMFGLFTTLAGLIARFLDGVKVLQNEDRAELENYLEHELKNARHELNATAAAGKEDRMQLLSSKIFQLIMALDPEGAFMH